MVAIAVALVAVLARLLGGGSDGSDDADEARTASGEPSETTDDASETTPAEGDPAAQEGQGEGQEGSTEPAPATEAPPAQPDGECAADDVVITPRIDSAIAGSPVDVTLSLTTRETPACYWTVASDTAVVKVTSGNDDIWSSQHCPEAIVPADLVVRKDSAVEATLQWPAWRSGADCTIEQWSMPGYYHVEAAPLAGEPTATQFELVAPEPEVVDRTPEPTATDTATP